jgi:hypothetical protein
VLGDMKSKSSVTELLFNPRQKKLHHHNYHHLYYYNYHPVCNRLPQLHHRICLRNFSSTCSVINSFNKPSFKLSRMGRQQDPVLIQSSNSGAENRVQHMSQKSHSTLSAQTNINGHTTTTTTPKQYPFFPFGSKNQEMIMGINCLLFKRLMLDTTLSLELRNKLGLRGVLPPAVDTPDIQIERCLARIRAKTSNLDK